VSTRINLILPETRVMAYIAVADSMGLCSFKFLRRAPKDASVFAAECISAIQSHPRSLILAPIERAYASPISD